MVPTTRSLLVAPDPILGESPASWLHRLCLTHGRGARTILKSMGIPKVHDPDIDLAPQDFRQLVHGTQIPESDVSYLGTIFQHVREARFHHILLRDDRGQATYGFCSICLAGDAIPHFRIGWRFVDWKICPEHQVRIRYRCTECAAPIRALRPGQKEYVLDLKCCPGCAADLSSQPVEQLEIENVVCVSRTQRALVSAFLRGYCLLEGYSERLPLEFVLWSRDAFPLEGSGDLYATTIAYQDVVPRNAFWLCAFYRCFKYHGIKSTEALRAVLGQTDHTSLHDE